MSWKREEIPDHKFDYVDVDEFTDNSWSRKLAYSSVFMFALKDILVYMADLGSVLLLVASNRDALFSNTNRSIVFSPLEAQNLDASVEENPIIRSIGGTVVIFTLIIASLFASFLLLAFEWKKGQRIIKSRDISYAFTSEVAYSYYTIRSYPHYCFFSQIQNSRKPVDVLAFWVFFKFKGWKRLLLAEFPRQFLNSLIVYDIFNATYNRKKSVSATLSTIFSTDTNKPDTIIFLSLQLITITIWIIGFLGLFVAVLVYIPLLCNIRGNLKEYCVHKVDKRIDEILKRKTRKRLQDARRQEQERIENSSGSTLGDGSDPNYQQPTLPQIDVDLDSNAPSSYVSSHVRAYGQYQNYRRGSISDYGGSQDGYRYAGQGGSQVGTAVPPMPSQYQYGGSAAGPYVYTQTQQSQDFPGNSQQSLQQRRT